MKRVRLVSLIVGTVVLVAVVAVLLLNRTFLKFRMPDSSMEPAIASSTNSAQSDVALVLKTFRTDWLKRGDFVLIERSGVTGTVRTIRRFEKKDDSDRIKVTGRGTSKAISRGIAQKILDMDYEPRFFVSALRGTESSNFVVVVEHDIKGRVIHVSKKGGAR